MIAETNNRKAFYSEFK